MVRIDRSANGSAVIWSYKSYIVETLAAVDAANASQWVMIVLKHKEGK